MLKGEDVCLMGFRTDPAPKSCLPLFGLPHDCSLLVALPPRECPFSRGPLNRFGCIPEMQSHATTCTMQIPPLWSGTCHHPRQVQHAQSEGPGAYSSVWLHFMHYILIQLTGPDQVLLAGPGQCSISLWVPRGSTRLSCCMSTEPNDRPLIFAGKQRLHKVCDKPDVA